MMLPSDNKKLRLYKYYVKYKDAHYGNTWFAVVPDSIRFDPFAEHFVFENLASGSASGFDILGWKGDTIKSNCILTDKQPGNLQPFRREVKRINDNPLSINYYFANSFGIANNYFFDSWRIKKDTVTFFGTKVVLGKNEKYALSALKGQVEVPLGDTIVRVNKLEKNMNFVRIDETGKTLVNQPRVAIESYKLSPNKKIDWKKLKESGVFVEQLFNK